MIKLFLLYLTDVLLMLRAEHIASLHTHFGDEWHELVEYVQIPSTEYGMLLRVNNKINRLSWRSDLELWEQEDYWATPTEFLEKRKGDCEDFAIAKYFLLLDVGVDPSRIALVYANIEGVGAHMALAYWESSDPYILDNRSKWIERLSKRTDLKEVQFIVPPL